MIYGGQQKNLKSIVYTLKLNLFNDYVLRHRFENAIKKMK